MADDIVDHIDPAWPHTRYTAIIPGFLVVKGMQDFYRQQEDLSTCSGTT